MDSACLMHWLVEIKNLGKSADKPEEHRVDAPQWQEALKTVRQTQGLDVSLRSFSIEILEHGVRAVDPEARLKYFVKQAPSDAGAASAQPSTKAKKTLLLASEGTALMDEPHEAAPTHDSSSHAPVHGAGNTACAPDLVLGAGATLVVSRLENGSAQSPLTYREFGLAMAEGTTPAQAEALLMECFSQVKQSIEALPAGKLVHMAVFDHKFEGRPSRAPLVSLVWKDWRGPEPELKFTLDKKRKSLPPPPPEFVTHREPPRAAPPSPPAPVVSRAVTDVAPPAPVIAQVPAPPPPVLDAPLFAPVTAAAPAPAQTVDVPWLASPGRDYPTPVASPVARRSDFPAPERPANVQPPPAPAPMPVIAPPAPVAANPFPPPAPVAANPAPPPAPVAANPAPPPAPVAANPFPPPAPIAANPAPPARQFLPGRASSPGMRPRLKSNPLLKETELISDLFEIMHDLHFVHDSWGASDFVLSVALEKLHGTLGLAQLYDINRREFVVARSHGPGETQTLGGRTAERDPLIAEIMRKRRPFVIDASRDARVRAGRWAALGGPPTLILATAVELGGRFLGTIEIANPIPGTNFGAAEIEGMAYIAEQYAQFLATHGILFGRPSDPSLV